MPCFQRRISNPTRNIHSSTLFLNSTLLRSLLSGHGLLHKFAELVIAPPREVDRVSKFLPTCHGRVGEVHDRANILAEISKPTMTAGYGLMGKCIRTLVSHGAINFMCVSRILTLIDSQK